MKTILVVDDEESVVEFVASLLEDVGYRVLRAYDGREAFDTALGEHPDLIISDIMMPIMNGLELCHQLRETAETAQTPIILMTAGRAPAHDCIDSLFLPKPFDLQALEETVACSLPT